MRHKRDIDIERVIEAWLAPGPESMRDGFPDDILSAISRTPQRRTGGPITRYITMLPALKFPVAAAAAVLVLALVTLYPWAPFDEGASSPGGASPQPSLPAGSLSGPPPALQGQWVAAPRSVPEMAPSEHVALWEIYSNGLFKVDQAGEPLNSRVVAVGPDQVRLTSSIDGPEGCERGTAGTYRYTLSDDGLDVTMEAIDETCSVRKDFLSGSWSALSCDVGAPCRGVLALGRHESVMFDPRNGAAATPVAKPGSLDYTVPEGWANDWDSLSSLRLVPVEAYLEEVRAAAYPKNVRPDQVALWSRPLAVTLDPADCRLRPDPDGGTSASSLAAWLLAHPELQAIGGPSLEIDGHPAWVVDIDLASGSGTTCSDPSEGPFVPLLASRDAFDADGLLIGWADGAWEVDGWDFGSGATCPDCSSDPQRVIFVDFDGEPIVIVVDSADADQQASWLGRSMPIVESLAFPR